MEEADLNLILLRSLLSQIKPVPLEITWKLIVGIVVFLGILSAGFYFTWRRQMKLAEVPSFEIEEIEEKSTESGSVGEGEDIKREE